jgi:hypothetical protein
MPPFFWRKGITMKSHRMATFGMRMGLAIVGLGCAGLAGCASMGFKYDEGALRKQVAFDTQCPQEKIQVVDAMEAGVGVTKFRLNVCGQEQKWNRMGTSYFAEGKGPMMQ